MSQIDEKSILLLRTTIHTTTTILLISAFPKNILETQPTNPSFFICYVLELGPPLYTLLNYVLVVEISWIFFKIYCFKM